MAWLTCRLAFTASAPLIGMNATLLRFVKTKGTGGDATGDLVELPIL
jgi:hypothetical protein